MNTSTDRFTCPVAGRYQFYCHTMGNGGSSTVDRELTLKVNGSYIDYTSYSSGGDTTPTHHLFSCFNVILNLDANDYIEFWNRQAGFVYSEQYTVGFITLVG